MRRLCWLAGLALVAPAGAGEWYVAPTGSDANPGTKDQPFASVAAAQAAARARPGEPVRVHVESGDYPLGAVLAFDRRDSGTAEHPVVYEGPQTGEARFSGAISIAPGWWAHVTPGDPEWMRLPVEARGQVLILNLRTAWDRPPAALAPPAEAAGTPLPPGAWAPVARGFGLRAPAASELFCDGRPMTLARWPAPGAPLARTGTVTGTNQFFFRGDEPARWRSAEGVWLHGLWAQDWADYHLPLAAVDAARHRFILVAPPDQYGISAGQPYYVYNVPEELNQPGEYCVEPRVARLLYWPERPLANSRVQISVATRPLVTVDGAQHLRLRRLVFAATRGPIANLAAGKDVRLEGCTLRGAGQWGALVAGAASGLSRCTIADCGEEGVRLQGGDRRTLTSGDNFVQDCEIERTGRMAWTYKPAISFEEGCGNRATHNRIVDLPHAAILLAGNNHRIEGNEITRVCQETADAGAIYGGLDWSYRGNVIAGNYLHDLATRLGSGEVNGVYLDDCLSGVEVSGNTFCRISGTAIFCGGGRDNRIVGNLVVECGLAHYNDDRGRTRINGTPGSPWNLPAKLAALPYRGPAWSRAYPACARLPGAWSEARRGFWRNPEGCVFSDNLGWGNRAWMREEDASGTGVFARYAAIAGNDDRRADPARLAALRASAQAKGFGPRQPLRGFDWSGD